MISENLEPKEVFENFRKISDIPRCSHGEEGISNYLKDWAIERNLEVVQDEALNIVIKKSGSPGREEEEPVILQGHMDMVCEKLPDVEHDFSKDPITWTIEGDLIKGKGTTLGADNGIAVAMIMAVLEDDSLSHPPLEALITSDEETGMTGADNIDPSLFKARRLINLDSEEEGVACVGCAGGERNYISFHKETVTRSFPKTYQLKVSGLNGGHSGTDIDKGRGNANKLLGRALYRFSKEFDFELLHLEGGAKDNAIPRDAEAYIGVYEKDIPNMQRLVVILGGEFTTELAMTDPLVKLSFEEMEDDGRLAFTDDMRDRVIRYLMTVPSGIQTMSFEIPGLVESSTNMGVIEDREEELVFVSALRSSVESRKEYMREIHSVLAKLTGADFRVAGEYPAWEFKRKSPLREKASEVYRDLFGKELVTETIHAGLECALFEERFNDPDMISIGPDIKGAHAPGEALSISSTGNIYKFLKEILKSI